MALETDGFGLSLLIAAASPAAFHAPKLARITAVTAGSVKSLATTSRVRSGRKRRAYSRFRSAAVDFAIDSFVGDVTAYGCSPNSARISARRPRNEGFASFASTVDDRLFFAISTSASLKVALCITSARSLIAASVLVLRTLVWIMIESAVAS